MSEQDVQSDPYDWNVEDVVSSLCNPQSPLRRAHPSLSLPESESFAATLRHHDVSGLALLREIDRSALKDDLGIRSMGHRASILEIIEALRALSPKFQRSASSKVWPHALPLASTHGGHALLPKSEVESHRTSPTPSRIKLEESPIVLHFKGSPLASLYGNNAQGSTSQRPIVASSAPPIPQRISTPEALSDLKAKKRIAPTCIWPLVASETDFLTEPMHMETLSTRYEGTDSGALPAVPEFAPTTVSSELASHNVARTAVLAPTDPKPGVLHRDDHGRKKMMPICTQPLSVVNEALNSSQSISQQQNVSAQAVSADFCESGSVNHSHVNKIGRKAIRRANKIYIGPQAFGVDQVFFGSTGMGEIITHESGDEDDQFSFVAPGSRSDAQRLYVNNLMKFYLRQEPMELPSNKLEKAVGKVPYKDALIPFPQPASMLTISKAPGSDFVARRQNLECLALAGSHGDGLQFDASKSFEPTLAVNAADDIEWKALEKWKYMAEPDVELPLYGESGSEGEYDSETWKEMNLGRGEEKGHSSATEKPKPRLSDDAVSRVIDQGIQNITERWTLKMLPKLNAKAYHLWTRAKRNGSLVKARLANGEVLQTLNIRLQKFRTEIHSAGWFSEKKLIRACGSLEQTIYDIKACRWRQDLLQQRSAPTKPAKKMKKFKALRSGTEKSTQSLLANDEESITASDKTSFVEDDSLADFIVNDEPDLSIENVENPSSQDPTAGVDSFPVQKENPDQAFDTSGPRDPGIEHSQAPLATSPGPRKAMDQNATIDLTMSTDAEASPHLSNDDSIQKKKSEVQIISSDCDDVVNIWSKPTQKPVFKIPPGTPQSQRTVAVAGDPSDEICHLTPRKRISKPLLGNVDAIFEMNPVQFVEDLDRQRLLIWIVRATPKFLRDVVNQLIVDSSLEQAKDYTDQGLNAWKNYRQNIRGLQEQQSDGAMQLAAWFVTYAIPLTPSDQGFLVDDLDRALEHLDKFEDFYTFLLEAFKHYGVGQQKITTIDSPVQKNEESPRFLATHPQSSPTHAAEGRKRQGKSVSGSAEKVKRRKIQRDVTSSQPETPGARKRRVYEVEISQKTLDMRKEAHERMERDRERRRQELNVITSLHPDERSASEIIVNPGKTDYQDSLELHPEFGNGLDLKPHQVDGLQFLWREITANHESPAGCLLAQPMGLGKTAQIVALIVALAQARISTREELNSQLPKHLKRPLTMILSPPSLVANWEDELLKWSPAKSKDIIGKIFKVTAGMHMAHRMIELQTWSKTGGILLIPYSVFTTFVNNREGRDAVFTEERHPPYKRILTEEATLVIADEAHAFKGPKTATRQAVNQIETTSRIAITGSPLSNNLLEYYELVDWVAKDYFGTRSEFRYQFEEPITSGLNKDSSPHEYRLAMRKLKSLQIDLEPKVHRADFSILHEQLRGKEEFLIRLPLTKIQANLYRLFVELITSTLRALRSLTATFACLSYLKLICLHPKLYLDSLLEAQAKEETGPVEDVAKVVLKAAGSPNQSCEESPLLKTEPEDDPDPAQLGSAKCAIFERSQELLRELPTIDEPSLSNKYLIAVEIVRLSLHAGDKVLIFSHRPGSLDFLSKLLRTSIAAELNLSMTKVIGSTPTTERQKISQDFNEGAANVCTITTKAGGIGLNFFGANRVILMDEWFNPMLEQQAIGRSYRIGQRKRVFVYRLATAGTYEDTLQQQSVFKTQLAARVVDQKNLVRSGSKTSGTYIFAPREEDPTDVSEFVGRDVEVLDQIIKSFGRNIMSMKSIESFQKEDDVKLSEGEEELAKVEQLYYRNPARYNELLKRGEIKQPITITEPWMKGSSRPSATQSAPSWPAPTIVATMTPVALKPRPIPLPIHIGGPHIGTSMNLPPSVLPALAHQGRTTNPVLIAQGDAASINGEVASSNPAATPTEGAQELGQAKTEVSSSQA